MNKNNVGWIKGLYTTGILTYLKNTKQSLSYPESTTPGLKRVFELFHNMSLTHPTLRRIRVI